VGISTTAKKETNVMTYECRENNFRRVEPTGDDVTLGGFTKPGISCIFPFTIS